ncbi:IPT/TIG domain-containing protein [bacterium]|nr:IPT/TIG domain-containing protein [bacterium]
MVFFKDLSSAVLVSVITIISYILLIIPLEYFLTEYFLLIPEISSRVKTFIFLVVFLVVNFLTIRFQRKNRKLNAKEIFLIGVILIMSLLVFKRYQSFYQTLQEYPRIYQVSPSWGIQGSLITIKGKNFGPPWKPGRVLVNQVELNIKRWQPKEVIVELPVTSPNPDGKLYLINDKNKKSNLVDFQIKDPDDLLN